MAILQMILYSLITFSITAFLLYLCKKKIKSEKTVFWLFRISTITTILIHYSDFLYTLITTGKIELYDNLLFSVYPCNLIMWLCAILCFFEDSHTRWYKIISEFVALGGTICGFFGIILNSNYFANPNLSDMFIFKGLLAHNTMLFSTLLLLVMNIVKISALRNTLSNLIGELMIVACGIHLRLVDIFYNVDPSSYHASMYVFEPPFENMPWANVYLLGGIGLLFLFGILNLIEYIFYKKEDRWYNKKVFGLSYKE